MKRILFWEKLKKTLVQYLYTYSEKQNCSNIYSTVCWIAPMFHVPNIMSRSSAAVPSSWNLNVRMLRGKFEVFFSPNTVKFEWRSLRTTLTTSLYPQVRSSPDSPAGWGQWHVMPVPHRWYHITRSRCLLSHWTTIFYLNRDLTVCRGDVLTPGAAFLLIFCPQALAPPTSCDFACLASQQGLGSRVVVDDAAAGYSFANRKCRNYCGRSEGTKHHERQAASWDQVNFYMYMSTTASPIYFQCNFSRDFNETILSAL